MANNDALLQYKQLKRYDSWIKKYINASRSTTIADDITDQTLDLNSLILTEKPGKKMEYVCLTEGGSANIRNRPAYMNSSGEKESRYTAFRLTVENVRWESESKYLTKQTFTDQWLNTFTRYINTFDSSDATASWTEWATDTVGDNVMTDEEFLASMAKIETALENAYSKMPSVIIEPIT